MKMPQDENVPKPSNVIGDAAYTLLVAEKLPTKTSSRSTPTIFSIVVSDSDHPSNTPVRLFSL